MAKYFTGTSTGTRYEVGQQYKTGDGRVLTAQPDGSFKKEGNFVGYTDQGQAVWDDVGRGSVSRGSSTDASVEWYASGKDLAQMQAGAVRDNVAGAAGAAGSSVLPAQSAGSDRDGAVMRVGTTSTLAAMWAAAPRDGSWSGKDDPGQDNLIGGFHWMANPRWTNAELFEARYGEVGETLIGLAVLGADLGFNARRLWDAGGKARVTGALIEAAKPENHYAAIDGFMDWRDQLNAQVRQQNQNIAAQQAAADDVGDAWDARMEYQMIEGMKAGDWTAIPSVVAENERIERQREEAQHSWINPSWKQVVAGQSGGW